jgi:hypothetical protein
LPIDLGDSLRDPFEIAEEIWKVGHRPERQSTCAGGRASAEVVSNTTAATHESVVQFQTGRSQRDPYKADLHRDVGNKL